MKRSRLVVAIILIVAFGAFSYAQTATDVVKRAMAATGDMNMMKNVKTMSIQMKAEMAGREAKMFLISSNPDKMHMKMEMMGMNMTMVMNGKDAWMNVMGRTMELPMDKVENNRQMKDGFNGSYLLALSESETKYLGVKEFFGAQCDVIEGQNPNGKDKAEYYFDKSTGLLAGLAMNADGNKTTISMKNYKDVQGVKIPHTMDINVNGDDVMQCVITEIKLNPAIDESLFTRK